MAPERPPYIIVVGAGKVGFYLSKHLLEAGYEVALIEKDPVRANFVSALLGSGACLVGDGDEMAFLATSGIERADVVAAVTGDDEDNLVACQLAKRQFLVPRTIARVNDPNNVKLFQHLGVDVAVSATELIRGVIETGLANQGDVENMPVSGCESSVVRVSIPTGGSVGRRPEELAELADERILLVVRAGTVVDPQSPLEAGDQIILFTKRPASDFALASPHVVSAASV